MGAGINREDSYVVVFYHGVVVFRVERGLHVVLDLLTKASNSPLQVPDWAWLEGWGFHLRGFGSDQKGLVLRSYLSERS